MWTPHSYSQPHRAVVRSITISRSRRLRERRRLSSYVPQSPMASAIGRFRTKVRKSPIGGTPAGIIASRRWATAGG